MTAEFRVRQSPVRLQSMLADAPSVLHPVPPEWVTRLVDTSKTNDTDPQTGRDRQLSLLQARIDHAVQMNGDELRQVVAQRYADLGRRLAAIERKAVRMWNFMPDPTARLDGGRDRYMAFNQGRGDGYRHWPASVRGGGTQLPTASAVGIPGTDLIIFCLSSTEGGVPVENPRQTPAWRYSTRY